MSTHIDIDMNIQYELHDIHDIQRVVVVVHECTYSTCHVCMYVYTNSHTYIHVHNKLYLLHVVYYSTYIVLLLQTDYS